MMPMIMRKYWLAGTRLGRGGARKNS